MCVRGQQGAVLWRGRRCVGRGSARWCGLLQGVPETQDTHDITQVGWEDAATRVAPSFRCQQLGTTSMTAITTSTTATTTTPPPSPAHLLRRLVREAVLLHRVRLAPVQRHAQQQQVVLARGPHSLEQRLEGGKQGLHKGAGEGGLSATGSAYYPEQRGGGQLGAARTGGWMGRVGGIGLAEGR